MGRALLTLVTMATVARADVDDGSILVARGWFTPVAGSRDLWLNGEPATMRVNLDDFGPRREFVCRRLLEAGRSHLSSVHGVVRGDELKVVAEFFTVDGEERRGFVEVHGEGYVLGLQASLDRPDTLARYVPYPGPVLGGLHVTSFATPEFRRLQTLARAFENRPSSQLRRVDVLGRVGLSGKVMRSDAVFLELNHGPEAGQSVVLITGEIVPAPRGELYVVTKSGHRMRLLNPSAEPYRTHTLIGVWSAAEPKDLRVLKVR